MDADEFYSGVIDPGRSHYLNQIKQPIGYFYGGQGDFSMNYVSKSSVNICGNRL
jgi:hypothetical protein